MDFNSAIEKMVMEFGYDVFSNPFMAYSKISDKIGSSTYDKRLADLFFEISKDLDLVELFRREGLTNGRKFLEKKYLNYSNRFTKREFTDSINPLCFLLFPGECTSKKGKNTANAVIVKNNNNKKEQKQTSIVVKPAAKPKPQPKQKVKNQKFDTILFNTKVNYLELNVTKNKNMKVLVNKKEVHFNIQNYITSPNTLSLNFSNDWDDSIVVYLPRRFAKNILVYGKATSIRIYGDHNYLVKEIENLTVKNECYSIHIDLNCCNLKVESKGAIILSGVYKNVNVTTEDEINFFLTTGNLSNMNLKMNSVHKKIYGRFYSGDIVPRIKKRIGFTKVINRKSYVGNCEIDFDLLALNGTINVK